MNSTSIVRSDDLRGENRRRVINTLRANGTSSPASLAGKTGLSAASISSLTSELAEQKIVRSSRHKNQASQSSRGRPQSLIELNGSVGDIITLDLAIDRVAVSRINYAGKLLQTQILDVGTRSMSESELLEVISDAIKAQINTDAVQPVHHIGVAFQGVTENLSGTLTWSPIIQQQNVQLGTFLHDKFQIPVTVNNDCRLVSEALYQSHEDVLGHSFATVFFTHGVGLSVYINGQPFSGIRTSALEMGHLRFEREGALCRCGLRGCIEAYAADYGIMRLAKGQSIHENPPGRFEPAQIAALCEAAESGDTPAIQAFAIAGAAIGDGLAVLFALLDSMPVAMVGRSRQAVELMTGGINSAFREQRGEAIQIRNMLHCFDDAQPLLEKGLILNTLARVDHQLAYSTRHAASV